MFSEQSQSMASVKMILTEEIKRHVELKEEEIKNYGDLRSVVMKWAILRKTEHETKNGPSPMDVGNVAEGDGNNCCNNSCGHDH